MSFQISKINRSINRDLYEMVLKCFTPVLVVLLKVLIEYVINIRAMNVLIMV